MRLIDGKVRHLLQDAVLELADSREIERKTVLRAVLVSPWLEELTRIGLRFFLGLEVIRTSLRPFWVRVVEVELDRCVWYVCVVDRSLRVLQASDDGLATLKQWFDDCQIDLLRESEPRNRLSMEREELPPE